MDRLSEVRLSPVKLGESHLTAESSIYLRGSDVPEFDGRGDGVR